MRKKSQKGIAVLCAFLCLFAAIGLADSEFDPKTASYDELIFLIQRYGSTEEKRDLKKLAWEEMFARGPDAFRAVMDRIHIENVMIGVLAQNMVEQMDPTNTAPILVDSLSSTNARTRKIAMFFLGFHETPQYADQVLPLLEDSEVSGATMRTLGKWHVTNAVPQILPFLKHEREVRRIAAANALREIRDPATIPDLLPLLGDPTFTVRKTAGRALAAMGEPAVPALLGALPASGGTARREIIRVLGDIEATNACRALNDLLESADPMTRRDIESALGQIPCGN